jgi:AAA15 family ATPase/GTPase
MVIDEFERSLHPLICSYLIQLFHDPKINSRGAQLVLATHDTNLLSSNEFRRDQIWIVEKDKTGASELYSLSDVTGILKGAPYEKWYLSGRLGGIPGIQSLDFELNYASHEAN